MIFMRVLGGLLAATALGLILGAVKDYLHLWPDADFMYVWPLAMGGAAFAGAFVMALCKPYQLATGQPARSIPARTTPPKSATAANKPSAQYGHAPTGKAEGHATSAEVPGMPTFDFDKARTSTGGGTTAASAGTDKPQGQT